MERMTLSSFDRCPLLKHGFEITSQVNKSIFITNKEFIAYIALLACSKCQFNKNGCTPSANFFDIHEIEARIDQE
jgi:hypothetical protein